MTGQIIKKFEETVYTALDNYAKKYSVQLEETGLNLAFDDEEEIIYTVLLARKNEEGKVIGFDKVEQVGFTTGILLKKIDFSGRSMYVPLFIKQIMTSICKSNECNLNEIFVNIFPQKGKAIMYLYLKGNFIEILDLKKLLE
jgi:hypothetical protein